MVFLFTMTVRKYNEDEIVFQEKSKHPSFVDIEGWVSGRLTVMGYAGNINGSKMWFCKCQCGNTTRVSSHRIKKNTTTSCGCYATELLVRRSTTHGYSKKKSPEYLAWANMRKRCNSLSNFFYADYGGRGISICKRWDDFENFLSDMGKRPGNDYSIDRIDNDENYEPGNVRWATQKQQCNNRRNNFLVTFNGETKTIAQWRRDIGIDKNTLRQRIVRGWEIERALTAPVSSKNPGKP